MIIKEIRSTNFFRFHGEVSIKCEVDSVHNVTVIRGENGTGKTTMLNMFHYCLYGDVERPLDVANMLNDLAAHEMQEGETRTAGVEITFEEKGTEYTATRQQLFRKRSGITQSINEEFYIIHKNPRTGNPQKMENPSGFIEGIIPEKLRGFFFFDGERIDRLAKIDGREEIRQAILDILGLTTLESVREHLERIEGDLTREQKKYLSASAQDLVDEYDALIAENQKKTEELDTERNRIRQASENIERIEEFLRNHNSASVKSLQGERDTATRSAEVLLRDIKQKNKELLDLTTRDFKHYLVSISFERILGFLENKRKKGELPSDVKEQFINDLLDRGVCICGRELVKDTPHFNAVLAKKSVAGKVELDDAYHKLTAYMRHQQERIQILFPNYHALQEEIMRLEQQRESFLKRIEDISKELKDSQIEDIRMKEHELVELRDDLRRYHDRETRLKMDIEQRTIRINEKSQEIQDSKVSGERGEAVRIKREQVRKLGQLNQEFRTYFMESTRANLDERIREVFDSMKEKPYRFARLTNDFVLEITNDLEDEDDRRVLSTGEGQVASLAFIASLVSYAREKQDGAILSDFSGGDFPIVMDSPFGNLSAGHKSNVAREIGNLASQVIVIVSGEQWNSTVEENITPRVSGIYIMSDGTKAEQTFGEHTSVRRQNNG